MLIKDFTKKETEFVMKMIPRAYKKMHKGFKITAVIEHSVYVELAEDDKFTFLDQKKDYVSCLNVGANLLQLRRENNLKSLLK